MYDNKSVTDKALEKFGFYFQSNNSFKLDREKDISAELNYWFISPFLDNALESDAKQELDIGFKSLLFHKKLSASLYTSDVFKTARDQANSIRVNGILARYNNYYDKRSLKCALRYHFGKKLDVKQREQNNREEKNRL